MSKFKDFICNSELDKPRTITYRNWTIKSAGEGENRCIYIFNGGKKMGRMWVDTHFYYRACFIHSVVDYGIGLYDWLNETCDVITDYHWEYDTWDNVDKLMWKLVDFIRMKS